MDHSVCKHIPKQEPVNVVESKEKIMAEARIPDLPLFEGRNRDYKQMKSYSLHTNELLSCQWHRFLDMYGGRVRAPVIFPTVRDIRFVNCKLIFEKASSLHRDCRRRMRCGPGTDAHGPLPIPNDMQLRKSVGVTARKMPKQN